MFGIWASWRPSWRSSWTLRRPSWVLLGVPWVFLGSLMGAPWRLPGGFLVASWTLHGPSWVLLGVPWVFLGSILEASWGLLCSFFLGASWLALRGLLVRSMRFLGFCFGFSWVPLGSVFSRLSSNWFRFRFSLFFIVCSYLFRAAHHQEPKP